jgi:UDP-glucose 4-epimerase
VTALAWVLGEGGLLGSNVAQSLQRSPDFEFWRPAGAPLAWEDPLRLERQLGAATREFVAAAAGRPGGWSAFWCAGVGVVGTSAHALAKECSTWRMFLHRLGREIDRRGSSAGRLFLASSAGGVYAGNPERPITELSWPAPVSAYGRAKLRQEHALVTWAAQQPQVSTLVARISNLYGPGQNLEKPQGLVARMSQCLILGRPLHVYVPMDTTRDYVFAADAGRAIVRWMQRLAEEAGRAGEARHVMKICASQTETTVAGLLGAFRQTARRRVLLVTALNPARRLQPERLQFRSIVWSEEPVPAETSLATGIDRLHRHQLALFQAGALPAGPPPTLA